MATKIPAGFYIVLRPRLEPAPLTAGRCPVVSRVLGEHKMKAVAPLGRPDLTPLMCCRV